MADDNLFAALDIKRELAVYVTDTTVDITGIKSVAKKHFRRLAMEYHPDRLTTDPKKAEKEEFFKIFSTACAAIEDMPADKLTQIVKSYLQNNDEDDAALLAQAMTEIDRLDTLVRAKDEEVRNIASAMASSGRGGTDPRTIIYQHPDRGISITLGSANADIGRLIRQLDETAATKDQLTRIQRELATAQRTITGYDKRIATEEKKVTSLETTLNQTTADRDRYKRLYTAVNKQHEIDTQTITGLEQKVRETNNLKTKAEQIQKDAVAAAETFIKHQNITHAQEVQRLQTTYDAKLKDARENPLDKKIVAKIRELRDIGKHNEALQYANMVLSVDPDNVHARYFAGTIYQSQGQLVEAGREYQSILALAPKSPSAQEQYIKIKTRLLDQIKTDRTTNPQQGIEYCTHLLTLEPNNNDAQYFLATIYEHLNDFEKALNAYQQAGTGTSATTGFARVQEKLTSSRK